MNSVFDLTSLSRRHYKKDTRFVNDLYTLTYDDHESIDTVKLFNNFDDKIVSKIK